MTEPVLTSSLLDFTQRYQELSALRKLAETGTLDESVSGLPATLAAVLLSERGQVEVKAWARSFTRTFKFLDQALRQAENGARFSENEWTLGVKAELEALSALQGRLLETSTSNS